MNIEFGKYEIPFQVVQSSGETPSMGDKGFIILQFWLWKRIVNI